ncbi:IFT172 [Symbiodinium sp. KB8]|nr:IFT172 [Symbiodinium sp. KB8]
MKLTHLKTLHEPSDAIAAVTSVTFSPNNQKLAVVTADRVVHVYDEAGERRDRFSTKPAVKGAKSYIVTGMAWSPNSGMLAIAQSDNIVFVYNLGVEWGEKKSICNKFPQSQAVTCITWPSEHPQEVVFGTAEGKMKVGQLKTNKALTMYTTGSYTVSTCSSPDGHAVLSGHADGSIYAFYFDEGGRGPVHSKFTQHMCAPVCLGWGSSVIVAGADRRVSFYSVDGSIERTHAPAEDDDSIRAFTSIAVNPSGESVVLGNFDKLLTYTFNARSEDWLPGPVKDIPNLYTATSLAWRADGSRVALGSLCGGVDVFDAALRRVRYQGKFEFTYVSLSQVIVKRLSSGMRIVLRSSFGCEITRINVYQDRFLVANTVETLLLGDLASCNLSEIPWTPTPGEKCAWCTGRGS